jgi:hypothetical protein
MDRDDTHAPERLSNGNAQVSSWPKGYPRSRPKELERSRWRLREIARQLPKRDGEFEYRIKRSLIAGCNPVLSKQMASFS